MSIRWHDSLPSGAPSRAEGTSHEPVADARGCLVRGQVTFMLSIAAGLIQIVAAGLLWALLNVVGVFDQITQLVSTTGLDASGLDLANVFSAEHRAVAVTIFSIIEVVIFTVLITIVALLYNVVSSAGRRHPRHPWRRLTGISRYRTSRTAWCGIFLCVDEAGYQVRYTQRGLPQVAGVP